MSLAIWQFEAIFRLFRKKKIHNGHQIASYKIICVPVHSQYHRWAWSLLYFSSLVYCVLSLCKKKTLHKFSGKNISRTSYYVFPFGFTNFVAFWMNYFCLSWACRIHKNNHELPCLCRMFFQQKVIFHSIPNQVRVNLLAFSLCWVLYALLFVKLVLHAYWNIPFQFCLWCLGWLLCPKAQSRYKLHPVLSPSLGCC